LLRAFFRQQWFWLVGGVQWIWKQYAYLCEIVTALFVMLCELMLFTNAFQSPHALTRWYEWFCTFVWAMAPAYHLPAQSLPPALFWEMFIFPLGLVILPWIASALIRNARLEMTAWKYAPEQRLAYSIQRDRTLLSHLYVIAQFENTPRNYWGQRKAVEEGTPLFSPLAQAPISKYAGPFSFAYVTLSNYLSLSPWAPESNVVEGSLATPALVPATERQAAPHSLPEPSVAVCVEIFLFGPVRVRLVGADGQEMIIEKPRLAELLAYLAMQTRGQTIRAETIVTYLYYKEESEEKDIRQLYYLLNNDIGELRDLFKGLFQQVGLPYRDPFPTQGRGKQARRSLSESYAITDVTRLETAARQLVEAKQQDSTDVQALREAYEKALQSYGDGFLEPLRREAYAGSWTDQYHEDYQVMYHQLLWDAAEYEQAQGENTTTEAPQDCFRRSVQLYRDYAVATMPGLASERGLQHSMTIAGKMGEKQLADRMYCEYIETLKRSFHRKLIDPNTTKVWEEMVKNVS